MARLRFLLSLPLPLLAASLLILTGAVAQQAPPAPSANKPPPAAPPTQSAAPAPAAKPAAPAPKADKEATKTLGQAIDGLDPRKVPWIEARLWQRVDTEGLVFESDGYYLCGPNHRLKLDLKVHLGGTEGELQVVSDGTAVWNAVRVGSEQIVVSKYDLKKVQEVLTSPGAMPQLGEEFYKAQSLAGVLPLLQSLRQQLVFTHQEPKRWQDHDVFQLTGTWASDYAKAMTLPDGRWPPFTPRTCKLYLDRTTQWPYRVEWWGPAGLGTPDVPLMQLEFRDPHLTRAGQKAPERYAAAFRFDPGKAEVNDRTHDMTEQLARARTQIATPKRGPDSQPPLSPPSP